MAQITIIITDVPQQDGKEIVKVELVNSHPLSGDQQPSPSQVVGATLALMARSMMEPGAEITHSDLPIQ